MVARGVRRRQVADMKRYDEDYFERWYRGDDPPKGEGELRRQVALAVAAAESVLNRPIESVRTRTSSHSIGSM